MKFDTPAALSPGAAEVAEVPPSAAGISRTRGAADRAGDEVLEGLIARMRAGERDAVGEYIRLYGPFLQRRARGKLGAGLRRLVDSVDMVSTVGRRLDKYVQGRRMACRSPAEFNKLVTRVLDAATVDKVRALSRLRRAEAEDAAMSRAILERGGRGGADGEWSDEGWSEWVESAMSVLPTDEDRELLRMWLNDVPLFRIAEQLSVPGREVTPAAVRQRWKTIRERLRAFAESGGEGS
ncbi:MAG TPA: hypothetical protein PL072_10770 [Phycisphaerales bacterium]|mgnify:CR=1 FL=1|nr:hypothetical protein [Phycisphaerales bacterium]